MYVKCKNVNVKCPQHPEAQIKKRQYGRIPPSTAISKSLHDNSIGKYPADLLFPPLPLL